MQINVQRAIFLFTMIVYLPPSFSPFAVDVVRRNHVEIGTKLRRIQLSLTGN